MAKKVVATLKKADAKGFVKVIRPVRSPKTGAYTFKEEIIAEDFVKDYFK
jgi:hypothetical protein